MASSDWAPFPYPAPAFDYAGAKLAKAWPTLHAGDREPFPDEARVAALLATRPLRGVDAARAATRLQDAWRAFHRGDFRAAHDAGVALGPLGAAVAIKAGGIHASHLLDDEMARTARYEALVRLADAAVVALPDEPNSHFQRAFAIGRLSQTISIAKALALGLAAKVRESIDATLAREPEHAEAHTALGLYHAEIVGKLGGLLAKLTYGANAGEAEKHLRHATALTPKSPIAWIEYGNGLLRVHGETREDDVAAAFDKAAKLKPRDAMEALDTRWARDQIE